MATLPSFPAVRPSLFMDFANSGRIDPRVSTTRNTTATHWAANGRRVLVPAGVPRLQYDRATGRCLGMLMEDFATNLLTFSDDFTNASWNKSAGLTAVLPDAADWSLITMTGLGRIGKASVATSATDNTVAVDIAPGTLNSATVLFGANGEVNAVRVNISDISAGLYSITYLGTATAANTNVRIDVFPGGLRIKATLSIAGTTTVVPFVYPGLVGAQVPGTIRLRYPQLEPTTLDTSYIPTTSAAVTRAADTPLVLMLGSLFNEQEGAIVVGFNHKNGAVTDTTILCVDDGTTSQVNQHSIRTSNSGMTIRYTPRAAAATIVDIGFVVAPLGTDVIAAVSWGGGNFRAAGNGAAVAPANGVALPTGLTRIRFGQRGSENATRMTGTFAFLRIYNRAPTSEQLQRLGTP